MLAELKGLKENCKPVWQIRWRKRSQDWMEMEGEEKHEGGSGNWRYKG